MRIKVVERFTRTTVIEVPDNIDNEELKARIAGPHPNSELEWEDTMNFNADTDDEIWFD